MVEAEPAGPCGGLALVLDHRTRLWRDGRLALGGAPWGVVRISPAVAELIRRLTAAGRAGLTPAPGTEQVAAERLVERGLAHPITRPAGTIGRRHSTAAPVDEIAGWPAEIVIPAFDRPDLLDACLASLAGSPVLVVDDASTTPEVARVAARHGARLVRHPDNRGPAAARNSGLAATTAPLVAFLDADCVASPGWLDRLIPLFADPRVGAVAPRVVPRAARETLLARHERTRSALDMGARRALVRPGSALGFLPSAALVVRREALGDAGGGFDELLRVGEDVDLVWRLSDAGWHVRYEPDAVVQHEVRLGYPRWVARRFQYGTSAAELDRRHPGRLAPARLSGWNLAAIAAVVAGRPKVAAAVSVTAATALAARLHRTGVDVTVAAPVVGKGLLADAAAVGHALRREWWPLGWLALGLATRSRVARAATASMLLPVALEWWRHRPGVDPLRYAGLRLLEDAAYGSGVLASAARARRLGVLRPQVRLPGRS